MHSEELLLRKTVQKQLAPSGIRSLYLWPHAIVMMTSYSSQASLTRIFSQSLLIGTLTTISLLSGLTPGLSRDFHAVVFSSSAHAQAVNDDELTRYVRASLKIEALRLATYDEIKRANNGTVPEIRSCSLQGLSSNVASIWKRFCTQAENLIEEEGIPNSRYNAITKMRQEDPALERRVLMHRDQQLKRS
jgi:hypothetical protein